MGKTVRIAAPGTLRTVWTSSSVEPCSFARNPKFKRLSFPIHPRSIESPRSDNFLYVDFPPSNAENRQFEAFCGYSPTKKLVSPLQDSNLGQSRQSNFMFCSLLGLLLSDRFAGSSGLDRAGVFGYNPVSKESVKACYSSLKMGDQTCVSRSFLLP